MTFDSRVLLLPRRACRRFVVCSRQQRLRGGSRFHVRHHPIRSTWAPSAPVTVRPCQSNQWTSTRRAHGFGGRTDTGQPGYYRAPVHHLARLHRLLGTTEWQLRGHRHHRPQCLLGPLTSGPGVQDSNTGTILRASMKISTRCALMASHSGTRNDPSNHPSAYFPASLLGGVIVDRGPGNASDMGQSNFGGSINLLSRTSSDTAKVNAFTSLAALAPGCSAPPATAGDSQRQHTHVHLPAPGLGGLPQLRGHQAGCRLAQVRPAARRLHGRDVLCDHAAHFHPTARQFPAHRRIARSLASGLRGGNGALSARA